MIASGSSATGVSTLSPIASSTPPRILKYQLPFVVARCQGAIAPSAIDFDRSGITSAGSTSIRLPRPVQAGQAPWGLLNEKLRGSISPKAVMSSGQASASENTRSSVGSASPSDGISATRSMPPPNASDCSTDSASRPASDRRASASSAAGRITRSTTMSIVWRLVFASGISSSRESTRPSTRARTKPALRASSSAWTCSPLRSLITGASTMARLPAGSVRMRSAICCTVCREIGLPHLGQCGRPTRANSSRR